MSNLNFEIMKSVVEQDHNSLYQIYIKLINRRTRMNKWFDMFLDNFNEKMDAETRSSPVWKLYHNKFDEYQTLTRSISTVEYYLKKTHSNV